MTPESAREKANTPRDDAPGLVGEATERFWSRVNKTRDCWLWTGGNNGHGYGQIWYGGRKHRAHRVVWTLCVGPIPPTALVLHSCDNRLCVRPDHLFLGDHKTNLVDASTKGRLATQRRTHCPRGHPYSGNNLILRARGHRGCRTCETNRKRQHGALMRARRREIECDVQISRECFDMIREALSVFGCEHGDGNHPSTPPMMFPEWIACVVAHARREQREADAKIAEKTANFGDITATCERCGASSKHRIGFKDGDGQYTAAAIRAGGDS